MKNKTCRECKHLNRELAFCRACGAKWLNDSDGANCQYFEQKILPTNGEKINTPAESEGVSKKCPQCESKDIHITEYPSPTNSMATCYGCGFAGQLEQFPEQSVFDHITESPKVLAEKLVYQFIAYDRDGLFVSHWRSTLTGDKEYLSKPEAVAATIKELEKELK